MARITRKTQKIFAGSANANQIAKFGTMKTGTPVYSTDIETLQSTEYTQGWDNAILEDKAPYLEEMNGVQYGLSSQIAYTLQEGIPEWDDGTTYYIGSIVKVINNSEVKLYNSIANDNTGNLVTDTTKWSELKLGGGGGLEVGDIGTALFIDETANKRRYLNGQTISQSQFSAFTTKIKGIVAQYPQLACSENDWQAEVLLSVVGQCGKFVIDDNAGTIRLPKVININGVMNLVNCGVRLAESLPNITGSMSFAGGGNAGFWGSSSSDSSIYQTGSVSSSLPSGGSSNTSNSISFDASRSSSTYQDNAKVQQEAIQYPYFIQVATGVETTIDVSREIELNNPFNLFESRYSEHQIFNASWLLSNGQYNSGTLYADCYQALLVEANTSITVGTAVTLPSGKSYTKQGLSVIDSTQTYTDYDYVVNQTDVTFRLPIKCNLASGKTITNNETSSTGLKLYYYVGETVQDANIIAGAGVLSALALKTDSVQAARASMPSSRYTDLTLGAASSLYTAPANGWFSINKMSTGGNQYVSMYCLKDGQTTITDATIEYASMQWYPNAGGGGILLPIRRGKTMGIDYNAAGTLHWFRFFYAEGEPNE